MTCNFLHARFACGGCHELPSPRHHRLAPPLTAQPSPVAVLRGLQSRGVEHQLADSGLGGSGELAAGLSLSALCEKRETPCPLTPNERSSSG